MTVRSAHARWENPPDDEPCRNCRKYEERCDCEDCPECGEPCSPEWDSVAGGWSYRCECGAEFIWEDAA